MADLSDIEFVTNTSTPRCTKKPLKRFDVDSVEQNNNEISATDSVLNSTFDESIEKSRSFLSSFCADDTLDCSKVDLDTSVNFKHLNFDFIKPENIRDKNKNKPDHPDYDPKTLFVPDSFLKSQSPGLRQWWQLKSQYHDVLLLFKVGKFYELYHMDAVVAVKELNLSFMRGDYAHCGFPEIAYARFADQLVQRGYKVARVEQTETPEMMEKRLTASGGGKDRVVNREVCRVTSVGTKTYSYLDGEGDGSEAKYLFALCETEISPVISQIGVCFVDTSVGKIYLSQFEDDSQNSKLHTLFAEFTPAQILYPRGKFSARLFNVLKSHYPGAVRESLAPKSQFLTASTALQILSSANYFDDSETNAKSTVLGVSNLKNFLSESDPLGLTPRKDKELALSALGAIIWYLKECLIDFDVLNLKNFEEYSPEKSHACTGINEDGAPRDVMLGSTMVLDGVTLRNLNIVINPDSSNIDGTLLERLDTCATPAGKRLLRHWLCNPSCSIKVIKNRQDAIKNLLNLSEFTEFAAKSLKQTPDLERLLQKINALGCKSRAKNHPDSRAILFNMNCYNKRKVNDLLAALQGFQKYVEIADKFFNCRDTSESSILRRILLTEEDGGCFPVLKPILSYFERSFDCEKARKEGIIMPIAEGIDKEYDAATVGVKEAERNLDVFLNKQKSKFSCSAMSFITSGRNRYILEVPDNMASKLGSEFEFSSQRKGFKRYTSPLLDDLRQRLEEAENEKSDSLKNVMRSVFAAFSKHMESWRKAIDCMATLDVLLALANYAKSIETFSCCPDVQAPKEGVEPFIALEDSVHPCSSKIHTSTDNFIPNDVHIGQGSKCLLLITGPNMGGKSTLMRQVGSIVVLAQLGSHVPARSCSLSLVDRIFTRIGASDRIAAGQSTFFVELNETASILKHATRHSLVILDELGRGTATHDGTAIASAVLSQLAHRTRCRTLFSTHYHALVEEYGQDWAISSKHMACMVENENTEDPTDETITFLYKLNDGACPKSHGFHAAKLAGVPLKIIKRARQASQLLEKDMRSRPLLDVDQLTALSNDLLIETLGEKFRQTD